MLTSHLSATLFFRFCCCFIRIIWIWAMICLNWNLLASVCVHSTLQKNVQKMGTQFFLSLGIIIRFSVVYWWTQQIPFREKHKMKKNKTVINIKCLYVYYHNWNVLRVVNSQCYSWKWYMYICCYIFWTSSSCSLASIHIVHDRKFNFHCTHIFVFFFLCMKNVCFFRWYSVLRCKPFSQLSYRQYPFVSTPIPK